jgi:hypothetical protein
MRHVAYAGPAVLEVGERRRDVEIVVEYEQDFHHDNDYGPPSIPGLKTWGGRIRGLDLDLLEIGEGRLVLPDGRAGTIHVTQIIVGEIGDPVNRFVRFVVQGELA